MRRTFDSDRSHEGLEATRRLYRGATDLAKRLDEQKSGALTATDIFTPSGEILRGKLKDYCERLILKDPVSHARKIEELLWRRGFYDVVAAAKKLRKGNIWSDAEKALLSTHLQVGVGFYHHLILRLQQEYCLELSGVVDFAFPSEKDATMIKGRTRPKLHSEENRQCAMRIIHRSLICLGDLARYKLDLDPNWDPQTSTRYYKMAIAIDPNIGMPHNQLGTLSGAKNYGIDAVYHYLRCILCSEPFEGTEGNLKRVISTHFFFSKDKLPAQRCAARLFTLLQRWDDDESSVAQINEDCENLLAEIETCLTSPAHQPVRIHSKSHNIDDLLNSVPHTVPLPSIIFKIVAICLMSISKLQSRSSTHSQSTTAFVLSLLSKLLQITTAKIQSSFLQTSSKIEFKFPAKIQTESEIPVDANERGKSPGIIAEDVEFGKKRSENGNVQKKEDKSKYLLRKLRRPRKRFNSSDSDLSDLEFQENSSSEDQNSDISENGFSDLSQEEISDDNSEEEIENDVLNGESAPDSNIQKSASNSNIQKSAPNSNIRKTEIADEESAPNSKIAATILAPNSNIQNRQITDDKSAPNLKIAETILAPNLKIAETILAPNSKSHNSNGLEGDCLDLKITAEEEDPKKLPEIPKTINSDLTSDKTHLAQSKKLNFTSKEIMSVFLKTDLLDSIKICFDWVRSQPKLVKIIPSSSGILMTRIVDLVNLLLVDFGEILGDLRRESALTDVGRFEGFAGTVPLPEDLDLKGLEVLKGAQENLDWRILRNLEMSQKEMVILRIRKLIAFAEFLADGESGVQFDVEKKLYFYKEPERILEKKGIRNRGRKENGKIQKNENGIEEDQENGNESDQSRGKLMRHMGKLWLKAEVRALETRLKSKLMSAYLVPDHEALAKHMPMIKKLMYAKKFIIVIPSVVVSALDEVKRTSGQAREATRWLESQLRKGSRFLRAQRPQEHLALPYIKGPKPKDKDAWAFFQIVECCHYLTQQSNVGLSSETGPPVVTLLTGVKLEERKASSFNSEGLAKTAGINLEHIESFHSKWKTSSKSHG